MAQGFTVWVTGLPAAGKTEIATLLEEAMLERGLDAERVDAGEIRETFLPGLGSQDDANAGLTRLLGHVCHMLTRNGVIAVAADVSPSQDVRNEIRSQIGRFAEVYLKSPAGADATYEEPVNPEVVVETADEDAETCAKQVLRTLEIMEWIPREEGSDYNEAEEEKITKRLKDLGYI